MPKPGNRWTREEHILAFNLYCKIPFGTIHVKNPQIAELARLLGRSIGSVSFKLANLARLDPALRSRGIRGMPHGARGEELIWREFAEDPEAVVYASEQLLAELKGRNLPEVVGMPIWDLPPLGVDRDAVTKVRVNQSFFRQRILSVYNYRCCITGLAVQPLLVASHIVPWSEDCTNRLNPRNGLCLNALHDRAFDRGLMWVDGGFKVHFSQDFNRHKDEMTKWLVSYEGLRLQLPAHFEPDHTLLRRHQQRWADTDKRQLAS